MSGVADWLVGIAQRLEQKTREYGTEEDPATNFLIASELTGLEPWRVAAIYAAKHVAWFYKEVGRGKGTPDLDDIDEKLGDIAAYLAWVRELVRREKE